MEKGVFSGTWVLVLRCLEIRDNLSLGGASLTACAQRLQRRRERCGANEARMDDGVEMEGRIGKLECTCRRFGSMGMEMGEQWNVKRGEAK